MRRWWITLTLFLGTLALLSATASAAIETGRLTTFLPLVGRQTHELAAYASPGGQLAQIVLSVAEYGPRVTLSFPMVCGEEPRWAPDGQRFACASRQFTREGFSYTGIHIAGIDGSYVAIPEGNGAFAWSPDGSRLAFSGNGLEVINADGTGRSQLFTDLLPLGELSWSPDGASIAYGVGRWSFPRTTVQGPYELYVRRDGVASLVATSVSSYSWSPDSAQLAVSRFRIGEQIVSILKADGSKETVVGINPVAFSSFPAPVWSPDGAWLAWESNETLSTSVRVARADGSAPRNLGSGSFPLAWSPDSTRLAYRGNAALKVANVATGAQVERFNGNSVAWSPDGALIAAAEQTVFTIAPPASGEPVLLVNIVTGNGRLDAVSWSHDGMWVALAATSDGPNGGTVRMVAVSRDGKQVIELGPGSTSYTWLR